MLKYKYNSNDFKKQAVLFTQIYLGYKLIKGDTMNCCTHRIKSAIFFGLGLLVATLLPSEWVLIVASATLVVVSISCLRR